MISHSAFRVLNDTESAHLDGRAQAKAKKLFQGAPKKGSREELAKPPKQRVAVAIEKSAGGKLESSTPVSIIVFKKNYCCLIKQF